MRLLHLSDIHLSKDNLTDFSNFYLNAFQKDISSFHSQNPIDFILITGDLIDRGGKSFNVSDPYMIFENEFLRPIESVLGLTNKDVFFIPGNHDIDRDVIQDFYDDGARANLTNVDAVNKHLASQRHSINAGNKRIEKFKNFEKQFHQSTPNYNFSYNESTAIVKCGEKSIGFVMINDSWLCSAKTTPEGLFWGTDQLLNANKLFYDANTQLNIVLMHHPTDAIATFERTELTSIFKSLNFHIVFYGHTHSFQYSIGQHSKGSTVLLNARAAFNNPRELLGEFQPGYAIIDIDTNTYETVSHFRTYIHKRFAFDKDVVAAPGGFQTNELLLTGNVEENRQLFKLATKTLDSHAEDFDAALLLFKTDTIAPKSINEIFVMPRVTDEPILSGDSKVKLYSINDILAFQTSILLVGEKEVGKNHFTK